MKKKYCAWHDCINRFDAKGSQKYCSKECKEAAHRENLRAAHKRWRERNPEKHKKSTLKWIRENRERWNKYQVERINKDREAYNAYMREYNRKRREQKK